VHKSTIISKKNQNLVCATTPRCRSRLFFVLTRRKISSICNKSSKMGDLFMSGASALAHLTSINYLLANSYGFVHLR